MIAGLQLAQQPLVARLPRSVDRLFRKGPPDVYEAVEVTFTLFSLLAEHELIPPVFDVDELRSSLKSEYGKLAQLGYAGRLYPSLPASISFDDLKKLAKFVAKRYAKYKLSHVMKEGVWVSGSKENSFSESQLNGYETSFTARLALFRPDRKLGHFTGLPYDKEYRQLRDFYRPTQLQMIQRVTDAFKASDAGLDLRAADHRDVLVWHMMDSIRGMMDSIRGIGEYSAGFYRMRTLNIPALGTVVMQDPYDPSVRYLAVACVETRSSFVIYKLGRGRPLREYKVPNDGIGLTVGIK